MSQERDIADRLLRIAATASNETTVEERNFESLVRTTRRNFRRTEDLPSPSRGRKRKRVIKKKIVLLKLAHAEFFPFNAELKFLKQRGLGEPDKHLEVGRDQSIEEIRENIILLFHSSIQNLLRMCGFKLAKSERSKKIIFLNNVTDGADLETEVGQGKIIVLPKKDFPCDLPILENDLILNQLSESSSTPPSNHSTHLTRRRRIIEQLNSEQTRTLEQPSTSSSPITPTPLRSRILRMQLQNVEESEEEDIDEHDDDELSIIEEISTTENQVYLPSLPDDAPTTVIKISRPDCLNDLMNIYQDEQIVNTKLSVEFINELGIDGGGLTKEVFNIFFEKCENLYLQGEDCLIPYLPLNKRNELDRFIAVGRVIQHMLILTGTIPAKLSRITLMLIANPDVNVDSGIIIQELLNFVNPYLRKVLKKAQKNFPALTDKEKDVIQDFYQENKFYSRPSSDAFSEQILTIADEILIQTPKRFIEKLRQGVSPDKYPNFWKNCDFGVLMEMQTPTPKKVVNCLITDPELKNEENDVFHYFTMYINCLDKEKLSKLVFLITGSFLMPNYINVKFNDSVGLSQRPIFSTCTDTITLPKTYANYNELKSDLNICLCSEEAKEYTSY